MLISNDATAQGFTITEAALDRTEVAELARALETSDLDRSRAGARHLMNHPAVSAVAADRRMVAIAGRFLGEPAIPRRVGTAIVRRHDLDVSVLLVAITVLELDPRVRETHSVAVAGQVVVLRPCGNLLRRPVGSAGAVGPSPVPLLQEVLVLAFELVIEDDALDASALVTNLRLDVAGRAVDLCVVGQLARLLEARVERLPRLASVLTPIRFEQVSASIREHDDVLVPSLQPGALQQTGRQKMIEAPLADGSSRSWPSISWTSLTWTTRKAAMVARASPSRPFNS